MRKKRMKYIQASVLLVAGLLFGYGVSVSTPSTLAIGTQQMLAAVGVSASVAPNQYNTLAQQLSNKEAALNAREAQLQEQTKAASSPLSPLSNNQFGFYSLCISIALFVLVSLNFYFDIRRNGTRAYTKKFSVDLR